jgi:hypothetical protein
MEKLSTMKTIIAGNRMKAVADHAMKTDAPNKMVKTLTENELGLAVIVEQEAPAKAQAVAVNIFVSTIKTIT